ncbi:Putative zn(2)-C6 fungal-type DNA-binding domain, fungal transcription factor [Septoria linicola]|uniref:Zn(2)-C6 fungal-type DNA-binding domain, fungal transcription factor n=1 Tax=Septoria linicola TaxID=215465 RepID=A0A9Q9B2B0_9PEZI|nr:putative zn(2)-C6 fungal-type DNA-binding domain, fungal transcription factor [Septoria linicola]USW56263.1 Putative zn(2)-C6 fungal-type DNA-binding domain, fungal transcription factor [Septoria linicola]
MAITTLTPPESINFELNNERRKSIASCSQYTTYSSSNPSPELTSPTYSAYSKDAIITRASNSVADSPPHVQPKLEEFEDGAGTLSKLDQLEDAKISTTLPRKRGRPRKHPIVEQKKSAHARSKTGCGTCRRRKKKCDEARPSCQNCEKNNVICSGYDEKKIWRSGKQKAMEVRQPAPIPSLPQAYAGVDTTMDYKFLEYFTNRLATVLSVTDNYNPFEKVIVPMAMDHEGLMASLLYLSGSCMVVNASEPSEEMLSRQAHHNSKAMMVLNESLVQLQLGEPKVINAARPTEGDPSIAATLLLCLQTVCGGTLNGMWRHHVQAMKVLLSHESSTFLDVRFRRFVLEFLLYHDYSSSVTSLTNPLDHHSIQLMEDLRSPEMAQPEAATLLGVMDGLFEFISRIRFLRDEIRQKRHQGIMGGNYGSAWLLQEELSKWQCLYPQGTPRYWASLLYRQCVFLYLHRTIRESKPCLQFKRGVDQGLEYLRQLPLDHDDDATQSILLMPLFLLGCSAFEPEQRPEITQAFEGLQKWSTLGNIRYAKVIVEEIWVMMDNGRAEETWDWESIIARRGWDFLIT